MIYDIDYWMPLYHIYSTCNYLESPHLIEKSGREMSLRMIIRLKKRINVRGLWQTLKQLGLKSNIIITQCDQPCTGKEELVR